jgi:UDP-glucose 4-epimerase
MPPQHIDQLTSMNSFRQVFRLFALAMWCLLALCIAGQVQAMTPAPAADGSETVDRRKKKKKNGLQFYVQSEGTRQSRARAMERTVDEITKAYSGKKVLITGGAGFIGSHLAERLVNAGAEVTVVDALIPDTGGNLHNLHGLEDKIKFHRADVRDELIMSRHLRNQDILFNLAGQTSHMDSMTKPFDDLEINTRSQLSILEACRQFNKDIKLVFASTRQIYGKPDYLPVDERHPLRPVDVNGINKLAGEWYHILYNNVYGIRAASLRLTNTYGPRMRIKDARQTFVGIWIRCVLEGRPFEVWDGLQKRDYTYVEDCVDALLATGIDDRANGKIYNLGGDDVYSLEETAKLLVEVANQGDFATKAFPSDRKKIDIGDYYSNYFLIMNELGWWPKTTLRQGLSRTIDFFRANLSHYV